MKKFGKILLTVMTVGSVLGSSNLYAQDGGAAGAGTSAAGPSSGWMSLAVLGAALGGIAAVAATARGTHS